MTRVLLALGDVGLGVALEEQLAAAGLQPRWDAALADGPRAAAAPDPGCDVVVVDADHLAARLVEVVEAWRAHPALPGVVAVGKSPRAREQAPRARVALLAPSAKRETLIRAIAEATQLRLASGMSWPVLRAAAGLPPAPEEPAAWPATLAAARQVDIEVARAALRWHVHHYVAPTARLDALREERLLTVPELEAAARLDGCATVQTVVRAGPLAPQPTARVLWLLASLGAIDLTPEVRDVATGPRRLLGELRAHLRARAARLAASTYYDVLEVTPLAEYEELEAAHQLVGLRFSPAALAGFDLGELRAQVQPLWDLVDKARGVLVDHAARGRYHDWLRAKLPALRTVWAVDPTIVRAAAEAYARGQRALGAGDVHKAMSELAAACRQHPGHPDYEASLAWARYRVQVASGRDRAEAAAAERRTIEALLLGCRPWPRALVALSLICAAGGDADAARWHLHTALAVDPSEPAAAQLAQRLGMRG